MVLSVSCWESFVSRAMLTFLPHAFWLVQLCLVFHTCCQIISAPKLFCYSLFAMLLPHLCCRPPAKPPDSFCFHSSSWASSQASRGILCLESSFTTGSPQNSSILVVGIQAGPKNRTFTPNHPYLCIESRHPHIFTVSCALFAFRLKALVTAVDFHWLHTLPDFFFLIKFCHKASAPYGNIRIIAFYNRTTGSKYKQRDCLSSVYLFGWWQNKSVLDSRTKICSRW